jgi:hypothetical protein
MYQETCTRRHIVAMAVVVAVVSIYEYLKTVFLFRYNLSSGGMTKNEELERLRLNMVAAHL